MQGKTTPTLMNLQDNYNSLDAPGSSPKLSGLASARQRAKGVFTTRRKAGIVDAEVPMTTVQEYCMDSREHHYSSEFGEEGSLTALKQRFQVVQQSVKSRATPPTPGANVPLERFSSAA